MRLCAQNYVLLVKGLRLRGVAPAPYKGQLPLTLLFVLYITKSEFAHLTIKMCDKTPYCVQRQVAKGQCPLTLYNCTALALNTGPSLHTRDFLPLVMSQTHTRHAPMPQPMRSSNDT